MGSGPQPGQVLDQALQMYAWHLRKVTKVRGAFRVQTEADTFALKPVRVKRQRLSFLQKVNTHLDDHNYTHVLPWLKAKNGERYYADETVAFYATPWFGAEWTPNASLSEKRIIQSLADLHRLTENAGFGTGGAEPQFKETVRRWNDQKEQVEHYAEKARKRTYPSPFDTAFLNHVDELVHAASFAVNGLKRLSEYDARKPFRRVFCHRRIHRHNLLVLGDDWKWIDFDHGGWDVPMKDLALFFQRFPPKGETPPEILESWLKAYEATLPLSPREKQWFCIFIAYPDRVIKWLNRYYGHDGSVNELFYVQELEQEIRCFQQLKQFAKHVWPKKREKRQKVSTP